MLFRFLRQQLHRRIASTCLDHCSTSLSRLPPSHFLTLACVQLCNDVLVQGAYDRSMRNYRSMKNLQFQFNDCSFFGVQNLSNLKRTIRPRTRSPSVPWEVCAHSGARAADCTYRLAIFPLSCLPVLCPVQGFYIYLLRTDHPKVHQQYP